MKGHDVVSVDGTVYSYELVEKLLRRMKEEPSDLIDSEHLMDYLDSEEHFNKRKRRVRDDNK